MTTSDTLQLITLLVVTAYTIVTYRLLSSQNRQSFENKFFQLLNFHHEIVGAIERYVLNLPVRGRKNFDAFYNGFYAAYQNEYNKTPMEQPQTIITEAWKPFFANRQADLGHYFRNLYHVIKFIDRSDSDNKDFFAHLVRAQLSSYELLLLFYNCLGPYGIEKFKPLVEKYSLLENMAEDELISRRMNLPFDHKQLYDPRAFKKDDD